MRYPVGRSEGKTRYATRYTRTFEDAERALSELALTHRHGRDQTAPEEATLASWLTVWAAEHTRDTSAGTRLKVGWHLTRITAQPLADTPLRQLRPRHIEALLRALHDSGLSPVTVQGMAGTIRRALRVAVVNDLLDANPATPARAPRVPKGNPTAQVIPLVHLRAILTTAHPRTDLWTVIAALGLRHGEALGLQWDDVSFAAGTVHVRRAVVVQGNKAVVSATKTPASVRTLYCPQDATDALLRAYRDGGPGGWVFGSRNGTPLNQNNVRRDWRAHLEALHLPAYRVHDLRHTYATLMVEVTDPKTASVLLGHTDVRFTMDRYVHASTDKLRRAGQSISLLDPSAGRSG